MSAEGVFGMTDQTSTVIPAERLLLLDTALLFHGPHKGGGPDCMHCALELLHEIVTGKHCDVTPPGVTRWAAILPKLNDGPWRDDQHRTEVMRPYLKKFLPPEFGGLDPANDVARIYPVLDYACRDVLPKLLDQGFKTKDMPLNIRTLRALAPIIDEATAFAASAALSDLARTITALARTIINFDLSLVRALRLARVLASPIAISNLACASERERRSVAWEQTVRALLDRICSV
jgi:hypothetical protein